MALLTTMPQSTVVPEHYYLLYHFLCIQQAI